MYIYYIIIIVAFYIFRPPTVAISGSCFWRIYYVVSHNNIEILNFSSFT